MLSLWTYDPSTSRNPATCAAAGTAIASSATMPRTVSFARRERRGRAASAAGSTVGSIVSVVARDRGARKRWSRRAPSQLLRTCGRVWVGGRSRQVARGAATASGGAVGGGPAEVTGRRGARGPVTMETVPFGSMTMAPNSHDTRRWPPSGRRPSRWSAARARPFGHRRRRCRRSGWHRSARTPRCGVRRRWCRYWSGERPSTGEHRDAPGRRVRATRTATGGEVAVGEVATDPDPPGGRLRDDAALEPLVAGTARALLGADRPADAVGGRRRGHVGRRVRGAVARTTG